MKFGTNINTQHSLVLDESEKFDVTTKTARPITIRVERVMAEQSHQDGEWKIRATGRRILKSGGIGTGEKLDTWTYRNRFTRDAMLELFGEMSLGVREKLAELGVKI